MKRVNARRLRVWVLPIAVLALGIAACGGSDDGAQQEGQVVAIGASMPLEAVAGGEASGLTVTSLDVETDDGIVDVTVLPEDQAMLTGLFMEGALSEGDDVVIEESEDGGWIYAGLPGVD